MRNNWPWITFWFDKTLKWNKVQIPIDSHTRTALLGLQYTQQNTYYSFPSKRALCLQNNFCTEIFPLLIYFLNHKIMSGLSGIYKISQYMCFEILKICKKVRLCIFLKNYRLHSPNASDKKKFRWFYGYVCLTVRFCFFNLVTNFH